MAYVGFDASCISHIALLTYVRQRAWIEQAVSRGARVDPNYSYSMQRCVVFAPRDPLLLTIVREIEAEQEAALAEESEDDDREGTPRERQQTVVLDVALTDTQAHELNIVDLTPELTERYTRALADNGLSGTPGQFFHAINSAFGAAPMPFAATAPLVGLAEQEDALSKRIEDRCRATDYRRSVPFGTTNREMMQHFSWVSRTKMDIAQLAQALAWLDYTYPLAA
jgi:hypothetical protein